MVAITGASSGFGYHFAGVLAAQCRVVLGARRLEKLEDCVTRLAKWRRAVAGAGYSRKRQYCGFSRRCLRTYGRCDVVINNAGVEAGAKTYHTIDEDDWDFVLDTNLKSAWFQALYRSGVAHNQGSGNIIMVSSITDSRTRASFHTPYQRAV